ncbi:NAD(P)H-dependent glycerol-3-phosphate dehydrogenase [Gracilibacillus halophilus YIM-C55.5]|uniref:Glycerol-3-phosphate dehydrogenase [NAD(P)+] n=1 Tax=Gracilibacillus halophilus YIM-C55.5 TaxID=1308866 RepID=N4WDL4_9BACI|nr:NAD(P)H-dependent glycerol-3-phosphate dehydrogenase [Gracilibacillus halophilus]ENH97349.1 NAD(P)H-dependent glycerol-3-phosphate dehydrogenase [Gracilibacillus halophilus YIM-C55.5]
MSKVTVLGAGSWGTALSMVLCDNHLDVCLWTHRSEQKDLMQRTKKNERYLPNITLPDELVIEDHLEEAIDGADAVVIVVPTKAIRSLAKRMNAFLKHHPVIIHASKGIEPETHLRISEVIGSELSSYSADEIVALSGPSHAEEVGFKHPTTITAASQNKNNTLFTQDLFMTQYFRVYTSSDIIGVELGGALKNIIALGAGISDGLGYGDNAKAALITRGLAEITRLAADMGANPLTFNGLSGVGDLIVTCTSVHSRNWKAGHLLGQGYDIDDILAQLGMIVEGIRTTEAVHSLAKKQKVDMPITDGIYSAIFDNRSAKEIVDRLMARDRTNEMDDISSILSDRYSN